MTHPSRGIRRNMATASPADNDIRTSGLTLPAYVLLRPEGVFIKLSPPPAQDILRLFVDRLFSNDARFAGLDYASFISLLYDTDFAASKIGSVAELRIANNIVRFTPQRRALYRGVNIIDAGERAEYMFELVFVEVVSDEPVNARPGSEGKLADGGAVPVVEYTRKIEMQPTKLDFDEFVADMWVKGVRFGIDADAVRKVIEQGTAIRMEIARKLDPTDSKDAEIVEESDALRQDNTPLILPNGKADLRRAKNRFPQVAKDMPLLRKIPRVLGKPGYLVTGAIIEPRLPLDDLDLNKLAGEGTRIDRNEKGEFIVAAMDGFLCLDENTGQIGITAKIENRGGISAKGTGDIKLTVDEYVEHGEVQEGRVVEGKHMTFLSDVFGTVIANGGNIQLGKNLSGGKAQSIGGDITVKSRAINTTLEAWDGKITAHFAESCTIIGKSVSIERAVNCEIIAEELQLGIAEGCAIAGKKIRITSSNAHRNRETVITILLPDLTSFDQQIAKIKAGLTQIDNALQAKSREITAAKSDPAFVKYLAIAAKIQDGSIKLSAEQQPDWQKVVRQFMPIMKGTDELNNKRHALENEIERLAQARKICSTGEGCEIGEVLGDTVVRKSSSSTGILGFAGILVFRGLPAQQLKAQLQHLGTPQERIFSGDKGRFEWHFQVPEPSAAPV